MAQIIKTVPDFNIKSTWVVSQYRDGVWVMSPGPSTKEDKKSVTLSGIPAGSTINSAKITALFGSPNTGYAIRTVAFSKDGTNYSDNTIWDVAGTANSVPAEETIPVAYITPGGTLYVKFRFKANGSTSGGEGDKSSSLTIKNITITVDYTPPFTAPSVTNVKLAGGTDTVYAAPGATSTLSWTSANGNHNPITKYRVYRSVGGATYTHLSDTTGTSLTVAGPGTAGQNHRYYVIAIGTYSNSSAAYSPYLYAYKAPGAPTGVSLDPATVFTGKTTRVSWTAGAAGVGVATSKYEVYRGGTLLGSSTGVYLDITAPASAGAYNITVKAIGNISGYNSGLSTAAVLTVKNPASTGSLDKTTVPMDGSSKIKLTISSADNAFTHKAIWKTGSATVTQNVAAGVTSTTLTVPLAWCAQFPSAVSGSGSVTLETYNGSTKVGEKVYTFAVTVPASVVPSFTGLAATLVPNGVDSSITKYVQGYSKVALVINGASGAQGSTITAYSITGTDTNANAASVTSGPFNTSGSLTFTGKITDSRGRTATKTVTITVQPYSMPSLSGAVAYRCLSNGTKNDSGTYVLMKATSVFSSIDGQNTGTLQGRVYMKGATPGAWQAMTSGSNLITGGGSILITKTYIAEIRITDKLNNYILPFTIPTDLILLHGMDGVQGAAVGKYAERPNAFDIPEHWVSNIALLAYPVGAIYLSTKSTNPGALLGGTWTSRTPPANIPYAWERTA